ncbi:hypothetical protein Aco03nite_068450 [Actinoplanes couchii]|uniref:Uncharacterized protein n=1 Tax=Actinoplanes couchii TaxID=403638 RepID=A0ABQ3XIW3_9ACTN|nr:hypothetical protein Aco03nite_068450 [Actinoplanes couchii]
MWISGLAVAVGAGAFLLRPSTPAAAPAVALSVPPPASATPLEKVRFILEKQEKALVDGDEKAWLAPVDAKLQGRYRAIFRNLRALDLTQAELEFDDQPDMTGTTMVVRIRLSYCFDGVECMLSQTADHGSAPDVVHKLTWTVRDGAYQLTGIADSGIANGLEPAPWEDKALSIVRGPRVTLAAPASTAGQLDRFLPLAEKAAVVADRYAGKLGNPQPRYRIYLADKKSWNSWYSKADPGKLTAAYHLLIGWTGSDTVVHTELVRPGTDAEITALLQHELTHGVTLNGNKDQSGGPLWLVEGIAEYIGNLPRQPKATDSRYFVRGPRTIAVAPVADDADSATVSNLYATGHFAVGCMAAKYGEPKMLDFVARVVRKGQGLDPAARAAFGKPFKTVDKACVSWIKQQIG